MTIKVSIRVAEFVRGLAQTPRRELRLGIRGLAHGRGDVRELEGELEGYWRLRVGSYRVLFLRSPSVVECVFAEKRSIVYEIFAEELRRKLTENEKNS